MNPNRMLIRGILSFAFGIAALAVPGLTLELVIQALGALLLIDGLINLLIVLSKKKEDQPAYLIVPRGTTNLIIGTVLLLFPAFMVGIFVFIIGLVLLVAGASQFLSQLSGRSALGFSWVLTLFSMIALLSGVVMLFNPFESAQTILIIFGAVIALYGAGEVIGSFRVRRYRKEHPPKAPDTVDAEYEEV
ncbi:MAG TPA: DUF308 domain-containing protein [Prolixibacteraceae bacterium]|nr:DUF308 domain-containing protein [Prolixibacteraceae bacterium]